MCEPNTCLRQIIAEITKPVYLSRFDILYCSNQHIKRCKTLQFVYTSCVPHDAFAIYYTQPVLTYMTTLVALPSAAAAAVIKDEEG